MTQTAHPLAGQTVTIKKGSLKGAEYRVEDFWHRVTGGSWKNANGNPAALQYAVRSGTADRHIPADDNVLYGKIGNSGYLVHASELED